MNKKGYTFIQNEDFLFSFVSQGNQGEILKVLVFQFFKNNKYNVALLDLIPETNEYSDEVNSNNGDITKVLTTVLQIIILFLEKNPETAVYLEGNSRKKQLLYNRIITNNFNILSSLVNITGIKDSEEEIFEIGNQYEAFWVTLKNKIKD